ncbi:MAG: LuxR family transcriptional regulator [Rhodobacter sp. CACIA14H1]|nr:MAG: LuxR family transcriptional regulator [Rhodobacter sp. CACIA14H1]
MRAQPNAAEGRLAETIRRLQGQGFESALHDWLRRCLAPDNIIILAYRDAAAPQVLFTQTGQPQVFAQLDGTYLAGAYLLDPYHDLHVTRVAAGAYRLRDVAPDAFHRSRYFLDYYQQTTLVDEVTFIAYPHPDISLNICLGRDASSGRPFTAAEVETAQRLAPVVAALAEGHWATLADPGGGAADVTAALAGAMRDRHGVGLSPRQAEVALLILRGHSTQSIGLRLGLSPQTVKVFRKQLYAKCGLSSQAELFALMVPLLAAAPSGRS